MKKFPKGIPVSEIGRSFWNARQVDRALLISAALAVLIACIVYRQELIANIVPSDPTPAIEAVTSVAVGLPEAASSAEQIHDVYCELQLFNGGTAAQMACSPTDTATQDVAFEKFLEYAERAPFHLSEKSAELQIPQVIPRSEWTKDNAPHVLNYMCPRQITKGPYDGAETLIRVFGKRGATVRVKVINDGQYSKDANLLVRTTVQNGLRAVADCNQSELSYRSNGEAVDFILDMKREAQFSSTKVSVAYDD